MSKGTPWRGLAYALWAALLIGWMGCGSDQTGPGGANNNPDDFCVSRTQCDSGEYCDPADSRCKAGELTCTSDVNCPRDEYCVLSQDRDPSAEGVQGICALAACGDTVDCETGSICDEDLGQCVQGCDASQPCPGGQRCEPGTQQCVAVGCQVGDCNADFQTCNTGADPPACEPTGNCTTQLHCVAYGDFLDNGNQYLCDTAQQKCVEKPACDEGLGSPQEGDKNCPPGQVCLARDSDGKAVCQRGCRQSEPGTRGCRLGEICSENLCIPGCQNADSCVRLNGGAAEDWVCVQDTGVCAAACQTSGDCPLGQVCRGTPVTYCQGCTSDGDCPGNQVCDTTQGLTPEEELDTNVGLCVPPPPDCPQDDYGDAHTRDTAYAIQALPFSATRAMMNAPVFCKREEHPQGEWFQFQCRAGQVITLDLAYRASGTNLDLAVVGSDGQDIVSSARPPDVDNGGEQIAMAVDLDQPCFVQVRGSTNQKNVPFDLTITQEDQGACTDDAYEDNDDIALAGAQTTLLTEGVQEVDLKVCGVPTPQESPDPDFYKIDVGSNKIVKVTAQSPYRLGDINLEVQKDDGTTVVFSSTEGDVEEVTFATTDPGTYYIVVTAARGAGIIEYDLRWTQRDNVCTDPFEQNDTCATASQLPRDPFAVAAVHRPQRLHRRRSPLRGPAASGHVDGVDHLQAE